MNWIWAILGIILVAFVAAVLYAFFIKRPRTIKQLRASAELVARETHGRPPDLLAPARCEAVSIAAKEHVRGVGALALTEQGLVFGAADPERTLIIARSSIVRAGTVRTMRGATETANRTTPMLAVRWQAADAEEQAAFSTPMALEFVSALNPPAVD